jgi:hypothetical protein
VAFRRVRVSAATGRVLPSLVFAVLVASAEPARARPVSLFRSPVVDYHGLGLAGRCCVFVTCWC